MKRVGGAGNDDENEGKAADFADGERMKGRQHDDESFDVSSDCSITVFPADLTDTWRVLSEIR
jgi:hypothetical protein